MLLSEAIAYAADGLDVFACLAQLLSQTDDLHVDGPVGDRIIVAVNSVEDLLSAENPAGATCEIMEDAEFGGAERYLNTVDSHFVPARMDDQLVDRDHLFRFFVVYILGFLGFLRVSRDGHLLPAQRRRTRASKTLGLNGLVT